METAGAGVARATPEATRLPRRGGKGVKQGRPSADRRTVNERAATDRRALRAPLSDAPPTRLRTLAATLHAGLYRPLAEDDTRAAYWVRHVRIGVLLNEVAALTVVGYILLTDSPARNSPVLLAVLAIVTVPGLLFLPLPAMMR